MTHGKRQSRKKQRASTPNFYVGFNTNIDIQKAPTPMLPVCIIDDCFNMVYKKCIDCRRNLCMFHFSNSNRKYDDQEQEETKDSCIKCCRKYGLVS